MTDPLNLPKDLDEFWELVRRYGDDVSRRDEILDEIERGFERTLAVLAIDTCGFTRATRGQGPIPFLAALLVLEQKLYEAIDDAEGHLLLREGDNFFAAFATPEQALDSAQALLASLARYNADRAAAERIAVSIGIGYGPMLVGRGHAPIGAEMNLACKIGEDLAGPDDLLMTPAARAHLSAAGAERGRRFEEVRARLSSLDVTAYRLVRDGTREA